MCKKLCCSGMPMLSLVLLTVATILSVNAVVPEEALHDTPPTATSTYVSIRVSGECNMELFELIPTKGTHLTEFRRVVHPQPVGLHDHDIDPTHFGSVAQTRQFATKRFRVSYRDPFSGIEMARVVPDPRLVFLDAHREGDGHDHDGHHHSDTGRGAESAADAHVSDVGYLMDWIPSYVDVLSVSCFNTSHPVEFVLPLHRNTGTHATLKRHFVEEATADPSIEYVPIRSTGPPDRVNSIVFLSDGFLASENVTFFDRVRKIVSLIDESLPAGIDVNIHTQKQSVPLDRYIAFWNVYAVFQASPQEGASRPAIGLTLNTNLRCYHLPQMERAISCDRSLSQALARVSPAPVLTKPDNVLLVVISNTALYGGTGLFQKGVLHIGQFFNGSGFISPNAAGQMTGSDATYASLINHECGHAFGKLLDEYDIGQSATAPYQPWANCLMPDSTGQTYKTPIPWQHWIDVFNSGNTTLVNEYTVLLPASGTAVNPLTGYGTDPAPTRLCGYRNYYKGSATCMMNKLDNFYMCPQCREGFAKAIYDTGFELQWPRYPLDDHILIISRTNPNVQGIAAGGVVFHLPSMLTDANRFSVVWRDNQSNILNPNSANNTLCPQCILIPASTLETWPNDTVITFTASIIDDTNFIYAPQRANISTLRQVATFRMILPSEEVTPPSTATTAAPTSTATNSTGGNSSTTSPVILYPPPITGTTFPKYGQFTGVLGQKLDRLPILAYCSPNKPGTNATCSLEFTQNSYNFPKDIDSLAQYDAYVLYVLGGVGVVCVLLWLFASARYKKVAGRVVRPIFKTEFSAVVTLIRRIMMVSSILFMFGAVGALVASGYFYTKTSFIGKVIIIGGVVVALCLYLMAFVGFWAISNRAKRLVMFNGIIMIVAAAVLIGALVVVNMIGDTIRDDSTTFGKMLTEWWTNNVKNDPGNACGWQGMLECSGWGQFPCDGVSVYVADYCPENCNDYNQKYSSSCQAVIQGIVDKWYPIVAVCLGVSVGLMGFAIAFNYIYYFSLWHMKKKIRERNNERVYRTSANKGLSRSDVDKAKALHVLRTLDVGDLQHLVKEFKRIDEDGNGTLSKKELGIFFRKALCYKISLEELNKIFGAMDVDGDGSISIEEFLAVFRQEDQAAASDGALLQHPQHYGGPMADKATLERQRQVRERINSTFETCGMFEGSPAAPQKHVEHATFQPMAWTQVNTTMQNSGSLGYSPPPMNRVDDAFL